MQLNKIETELMLAIAKVLNKTKGAGPEEKAVALTALLRITSSMALAMGLEKIDFVECCSDLFQDIQATAARMNE